MKPCNAFFNIINTYKYHKISCLILLFCFVLPCSFLFAQDTGNIYWYQSGYRNTLPSTSISSNGKYCLLYGDKYSISNAAQLYDIQTGSLYKVITIENVGKENQDIPQSVYLSPDDKQIFTDYLSIYDIESGQKVGTFEDSIELSNIQISRNGKYLGGITTSDNVTKLLIYEISSKKKLYSFSGCFAFQICNDNLYYAKYYGDYDSLFVFSLSENILIRKYKTNDFIKMRISEDEKSILVNDYLSTIQLYRLPEMKFIKEYSDFSGQSYQLIDYSFSPINPAKVAFISKNKVTLRDISNLSKVQKNYTLPGVTDDDSQCKAIFSTDGKYIVAYPSNPTYNFYTFCDVINLETDKISPILNCNSFIKNTSFTSDSKKFITLSAGYIFQIFDIQNRNLLCKLELPGSGVPSYAEFYIPMGISYTHSLIAASIFRNKIFVFPDTLSGTYTYINRDSAELMRHNCFELIGHDKYLHSLYFSKDDKYLVSGGADSNVIIWDLAARKEIKRFHFDDEVFLAKPSNDFSKLYLVTGDDMYKGEKRISIVNLSDGSTICTSDDIPIYLKRGMLDVISPDNKYIAVYSSDIVSKIYLFNCETYQMSILNNFTTDQARNDSITSLTFSPDGRTLAVGYMGKVVSFFDVESGNRLKTISYYTKGVPYNASDFDKTSAVCFSPDSKYFAAGSLDCAAVIWENPVTSVQENESGTDNGLIELFPNPVKDLLKIKLKQNDGNISFIKIYDILGNILYEGSNSAGLDASQLEINTDNFPKGYLILECRCGINIITKPFIKI